MYSRITGYYRPVQNWNDGKAQEFKDRKVYDLSRSHLRRAGNRVTVEHQAVPLSAPAGELLLFTTRTCPNCRQAEKLLEKAGIPYTKVVAEESPELAVHYGVRQAPTLVAQGADAPVKAVGLGAVKRFIQDSRPASAC